MKKVINTEKAPVAIGPYCQGILVNNIVYLQDNFQSKLQLMKCLKQ